MRCGYSGESAATLKVSSLGQHPSQKIILTLDLWFGIYHKLQSIFLKPKKEEQVSDAKRAFTSSSLFDLKSLIFV